MNPAGQIALWADRLRDLAAMGLHFAENIYDRERYRTVQDVAMAMEALATGASLDELEPLRATVFSHATPFVGGEAAVIDRAGRILLIRRADNGRWAMPGGALEVGETPAEGVLREVLEETGVACEALALIGVFDARLQGLASPHHIYLVNFLCRPLDGVEAGSPSHANEVLDVAWFDAAGLPANIHPGTLTRIEEGYRLWRDGGPAFFDREEIS